MTALAQPLALGAASPLTTVLTPRVGTPRRAAILTALAAAAMEARDLKAVLALARTGRPRSLTGYGGLFRWLALAALTRIYPEACGETLKAALGCRPTSDVRGRAEARRAAWSEAEIERVASAVVEHEDAQLTAAWVWPIACAVTAEAAGADAEAVRTVTGSRASPPRAVGLARKWAVYLTMTEGDVNARAMAAATGLNRETVRHHAMTVEDARDDDGALDATLETLAAELRRRLDEELSQW